MRQVRSESTKISPARLRWRRPGFTRRPLRIQISSVCEIAQAGFARMKASWRSSLVGDQRSSESRNAISGARARATPRFRAAAGPLMIDVFDSDRFGKSRQLFRGSVSRAVVDNNQLELANRLREHGIDRLAQHRAPIVGRDNYGDFGRHALQYFCLLSACSAYFRMSLRRFGWSFKYFWMMSAPRQASSTRWPSPCSADCWQAMLGIAIMRASVLTDSLSIPGSRTWSKYRRDSAECAKHGVSQDPTACNKWSRAVLCRGSRRPNTSVRTMRERDSQLIGYNVFEVRGRSGRLISTRNVPNWLSEQ